MENWLVKRAKLDPDKVALILEHADFTFKELNVCVQLFASKLFTSGIRKNDPVALFSDNCFNGYVAILALQQLGARTIMLDTELSFDSLNYQIHDCKPKTILISDSASTEEITKVDWSQTLMSDILSLNKSADYTPVSEFDDNQVAVILYTPNDNNDIGVMLTYGNFFFSAMGTSLSLGITKQDIWVLTLPIFNAPGFSIIMRSLIYGIGVYLIDGFDISQINKVLINERATIISLTPPMLRDLLNTLPKGKSYNSKFRCVFLGYGLVDNWTILRCNMLDIPVLQSYGMTDTTSNIAALSFNDAEAKTGSCGQPFFTEQIRITDINQDNIGCIEVKSPTIAIGYLNKRQLYQSRFTKDGFFKTGDMGYLDEDNFLYLKGRKSELIYRGNKIIYPREIENIYRSINGIVDICIVGIDNNLENQVPVAYIELKQNAYLSGATLEEFGRHNLIDYQVPTEFRLVEKIPKTTSGKILHTKLFEMKYKIL
ncbi:AMP-binding protein [Companilactobacillus bobalius]|uniref:O-succinylbenzoate--CoA ligase n=2 Tax=Companilactobacillus bobalius TaxID=2801451 RepID=A0A202F988_9LACO|nr:AMP-binding protein [Companilactobacillus bobalius]GEO59462.1 2-succinylbenzoate--CoA ligase [Companilactobacillus paralimentarius]KAE9559611.1 2-succinylbenzoate-CoA ligase [Companilactobacillus bobalius]KAE9561472.1 2-succinylbenzoate-CoA ligase [Companilactobacillus bobalius]KRK82366.1 O-succinylbenzoic acid--CoA ligase [Companilactobacillus bobalius DSM 19674]OVE97035.1 o-succinylbenzoate--CoA ligase [Companilactobacillus bobalius]